MRAAVKRPPKDAEGSLPPDDLQVDAFCIGAAKSGSSWLAEVVDDHPEIQVSRPKEPNFFTARGSPYLKRPPRNFLSSWSWYRDRFPKDGLVDIDFSIHAMADPTAPHRIQSVFPNARFLLILRDPVRRLYSHYRHEERMKIQGWKHAQSLEPSFEAALENKAFVRRSRYAEQLAPWLKVFPREQFHLMTSESARRDPLETLRGMFRFLRVDPTFEPPRADRQVHPYPVRRGIRKRLERTAEWLHGHNLGWAASMGRRMIPVRLLDRIDTQKVRYGQMDPGLERDLRERLLPEVEALERMFATDLQSWKPGGSKVQPI